MAVAPAPTVKLYPAYRLVFSTALLLTYWKHERARPSSILVSSLPRYLKTWDLFRRAETYRPDLVRDWVMDSGAFTAHTLGVTIDHQEFIDVAKQRVAEDPTLAEVFGLDVIGDWRAGLRNYEEEWKQGLRSIPTYHVGEPVDVLMTLARDYPKIALGGAVGYSKKDEWASQCMARVWPKKVHGLGFGGARSLLKIPFHSVDSSNGTVCARFGWWQAFGKDDGWSDFQAGRARDYAPEMDYMLGLEDRVRHRWEPEMRLLDSLDAPLTSQ